MPTLMVSPVLAAGWAVLALSLLSVDFEQPLSATTPAMLATNILFENRLRWNFMNFSTLMQHLNMVPVVL